MATYTISGRVTEPDDVVPWSGSYYVGIQSTTGLALDGDGSWRGGETKLPVDLSTGEATLVLPETGGGEQYYVRFESFRGDIKGPWTFTLNGNRTWGSIITDPGSLPGSPPAMFDVSKFGVRGNGATDDTAKMLDAIDALGGDPGGLIIPSGMVVTLEAPLAMQGGAQFVYGANRRASGLKLADGANCSLITVPDDGVQRYGFTVSNLGLDGNGRNQSDDPGDAKPLIAIHGMNEPTFENLYSVGARGDFLYIGQATPGVHCTVPRISNNVVRGDYAGEVLETFGNGINLDSGSSDAIVTDNDIGYFRNGAGVSMSGHNGAKLSGNNCWQSRNGFLLYRSNRTRMSDCLADYSDYNGFAIQESSDTQLSICQARESGVNYAGVVGLRDGFSFEGSSGIPVRNTSMVGCRAMTGQAQGRYGLHLIQWVDAFDYRTTNLAGNPTAPYHAGSNVTNVTA